MTTYCTAQCSGAVTTYCTVAEPLSLRLSAVVLCSCVTSLSTSGQQRFCIRTITCTARTMVGCCTIAGHRTCEHRDIRQRTGEKASKCQKPRTVSEKTGFDKREITIAYVGKGKQVSKATYGQEKTSFDKGGKAASGNSGVAILLHRKLYFMTTDSTEKCI